MNQFFENGKYIQINERNWKTQKTNIVCVLLCTQFHTVFFLNMITKRKCKIYVYNLYFMLLFWVRIIYIIEFKK